MVYCGLSNGGYTMDLIVADKAALSRIKQLYKQAFPRRERKPFGMILRAARRGAVDVLALTDGKFCGLMIAARCEDVVMLDYFAVLPELRGGGRGAEALGLFADRYRGCKIVLEIESPDVKSDNLEQRVRRKSFYLKNGLKDSGIRIRIYGNVMELLTLGGDVSFEQYRRVFALSVGGFWGRIIVPKEIGR